MNSPRWIPVTALFKPVRWLLLMGAIASFLLGAQPASAASGDLAGTVTFSQNCGSGLGTGVAYDGKYLWVSCVSSDPDLLRADPVTGNVSATYNIAGGLGSIAYDSTRNALWAGWDDASGEVRLVNLNASQQVTGSALQFSAPEAVNFSIDDGMAYDGTDDTLYISGDVASTIHHYATSGTHLGSFPSSTVGCGNSGLAIGGNLLFEGADGCSHVWVVNKNTQAAAFDFSTQGFRDEGLSCDPNTFASQGTEVMWSKEAFSPNSAAAFEIPDGTCGVGGQPQGKISARGTVQTVQGGPIGFSAANNCDASLSTRPSFVGTTAGARIWTKTSVTESGCTDQPPDSPLGFDTQTGTATGTFGPAAPGGRNGQTGTLAWTYYNNSPDTVQFTLKDNSNAVVFQANQQTPTTYRGAPGGVWTFGP